MTRDINLDIHGKELRMSCLADYLELQAANEVESFTAADLADYIDNCNWQQVLEPKYVGDGYRYSRTGDQQDRSRQAAKRVFNLVEQRMQILGDRYPFELSRGRLRRKSGSENTYLWFLFVSLAHGLEIENIPAPTAEFEKVVSNALSNAGIPSLTVGTSSISSEFKDRVGEIVSRFPNLVSTLDDVVVSRFQNDGGIDTFSMLECGRDSRHGQWAFIGQSTVGKTEDWVKKIHEPAPDFWHKVFGERVEPIPFFATPHHIQDDYFHSLFLKYRRSLIDRIRLTLWTPEVPDSFGSYESALSAIILQ